MRDRPSSQVALDCSSERPAGRSSCSMKFNLHALLVACATIAAGLLWPAPGHSQTPCHASGALALDQAWRAYRADSLTVALKQFELARRLCPANLDASVGLGFALLRSNKGRQAESLFLEVIQRDPANSDAWEGRARSALRLGDSAAAIEAGRRALSLAPANAELRELLDQVAPEWDRPARTTPARPASLQVVARTRGTRFEIREGNSWKQFYIQGVNFGVALPGRYPSEFPPDSTRYAGWLDTLAAMHANTIRLYTILPPAFYRALRGWNSTNPRRAIWLLHGVWTELPPNDDFDDAAWKGGFQTEMRRVVDVVHGAATIPPAPGHAAGSYDADVSRWTLGYIIGREWEPFAVKAFDATKPRGNYAGRFLEVRTGPAMDLWMARQCDFMLSYEADTYNALRPIAYTNWPTLDPLKHPTEAGTSEEAAWRHRSGRPSESKKMEYENDAIGLDANLTRPTPANPAGWFASYHAYPYYPDFMMLDPGYRSARSTEGPSSYFGYLQDLVRYHRGVPTLISEYGVPSSRGTAHQHPRGWSHGGHDELQMASTDARLTRDIREAGAAGAIVFAWLDEWFKKNWIVIDYEIPLDNTRRWHNVMDAEQNYGIMGMYAGDGRSRPRLGGDVELWKRLPAVQRAGDPSSSGLRVIRMGFDESYYYVAVELTRGPFGWDSLGIQLALDTHQPRVGQHRLPRTGVESEVGFEFLLDLLRPDSARMAVIPEYNRHDARIEAATGDDRGRFSRRPVVTRDRSDGRFDSLLVITNRARFGRDGTFFPAQAYDRGRLVYGTESASTRSDWYFDERAGLLQLRLPWDLLNVTDPSSRTLLVDTLTRGEFGTAPAADFHVGVVLYRKGVRPRVVTTLPRIDRGAWRSDAFVPWRWDGWTEPRYHSRLKPVYDSLKALWAAPPSAGPVPLSPRAPSN